MADSGPAEIRVAQNPNETARVYNEATARHENESGTAQVMSASHVRLLIWCVNCCLTPACMRSIMASHPHVWNSAGGGCPVYRGKGDPGTAG